METWKKSFNELGLYIHQWYRYQLYFVLLFFVVFILTFLSPISSFYHQLIFLSNKPDHLTCLLEDFYWFPVESIIKSKPNLATRPQLTSSWAVHPHTCCIEHSDCNALAQSMHYLCLSVLPPSSSSPAQLYLPECERWPPWVKSPMTNSLSWAATHTLSTLTAFLRSLKQHQISVTSLRLGTGTTFYFLSTSVPSKVPDSQWAVNG